MFLVTDQIKKVLRSVERAVKENGWMVITGEVGTGKTTLKKYLAEDWSREKSYEVLAVTSWRNNGRSRIGALMKQMIKKLDPDTSIPMDIELREERLKALLLRLQYRKKKAILVVDSAQDVNEATFRELKKLREIHSEPLFGIVMFGNESSALRHVLGGREVGFRCRHFEMGLLDRDEIIDFAENRFEINFGNGKSGEAAKELFCENVHPSPLGIEYYRGVLDEIPSFNGTVTTELIRQASGIELGYRVRKANIVIKEITREAKENGVRLTTAEVAGVLSGKSNLSANKIKEIQNITEKVIRKQEDY